MKRSPFYICPGCGNELDEHDAETGIEDDSFSHEFGVSGGKFHYPVCPRCGEELREIRYLPCDGCQTMAPDHRLLDGLCGTCTTGGQ